jgi:hypothetical protein
MGDKEVTQTVAAVATELGDLLSDISDKVTSSAELHDIGIHSSIIATAGEDLLQLADDHGGFGQHVHPAQAAAQPGMCLVGKSPFWGEDAVATLP